MHDYFLAYAGTDTQLAQKVSQALSQSCDVYLYPADREVGGNWYLEIPKQQQNSVSTLVLVTPNSERAYYQLEEVVRGIALSRFIPQRHWVVPIIAQELQPRAADLPYGLAMLECHWFVPTAPLEPLVAELTWHANARRQQASTSDSSWLGVSPLMKHPLHAFPVGPMVRDYQVGELSKAFAEIINPFQIRSVINDANRFRKSADPENPRVGQLRLGQLPSPDAIGAEYFWVSAFEQAALHGPRMMAALAQTVPCDLFPDGHLEKYPFTV